MSNDNALFEDDFDMEFEDDFDSALASVLDDAGDAPEIDLDPPMKGVEDFKETLNLYVNQYQSLTDIHFNKQ